MSYNIKREDELIDKNAIFEKLDLIRDDVCGCYDKARYHVEEASYICTPQVFTVNGTVLQDTIYSYAEQMKQYYNAFNQIIDNTKAQVDEVLIAQKNELDSYLNEQIKIARAEEAKRKAEAEKNKLLDEQIQSARVDDAQRRAQSYRETSRNSDVGRNIDE